MKRLELVLWARPTVVRRTDEAEGLYCAFFSKIPLSLSSYSEFGPHLPEQKIPDSL